MPLYLIALILFIFGYVLNMFYITVLYHRGLTHRAVLLGPGMQNFLYHTGNWVTGLDPKSWATMHRLHHIYSDTELDPHSPTHKGVMGIWAAQYHSYIKCMNHLIKDDDQMIRSLIADIPFGVSWNNQKNLSWLPYIVHLAIALLLGSLFDSLLVGVAYWLGIMSHPLQGWMVNALAHKYGARNFDTPDDSRNNQLVGYFVFGEGYQNNHHHAPESAKFSIKSHEIDLGYVMCLAAEKFNLLRIQRHNSLNRNSSSSIN